MPGWSARPKRSCPVHCLPRAISADHRRSKSSRKSAAQHLTQTVTPGPARLRNRRGSLVHGIPSALGERIAAKDTPARQPATFDNTVLRDRLVGIFGAGRVEPAGRRETRRETRLVEPDDGQHRPFEGTEPLEPAESARQVRPVHLLARRRRSRNPGPVRMAPPACPPPAPTIRSGPDRPVPEERRRPGRRRRARRG